MKRKIVFGLVAFLLVLQAHAIFAADYDEDFLKEVGKNNFSNMEKILQKRASQMDLSYTCMGTVLSGNISGFNKNNVIQVLQLLVKFGAKPDKSYYNSNGTIRDFSALSTVLSNSKDWSRNQLFEICQYLFSVGADANGLDGLYAPGLDSRQNVYLTLSIYHGNDEDFMNLFSKNGLIDEHRNVSNTATTTTSVQQQPAPAQSNNQPQARPVQNTPTAPQLDMGTYTDRSVAGSEINLFTNTNRATHRIKDRTETSTGNISISGDQLVITWISGPLNGKRSVYHIDSKNQFSAPGETWKMGF